MSDDSGYAAIAVAIISSSIKMLLKSKHNLDYSCLFGEFQGDCGIDEWLSILKEEDPSLSMKHADILFGLMYSESIKEGN